MLSIDDLVEFPEVKLHKMNKNNVERVVHKNSRFTVEAQLNEFMDCIGDRGISIFLETAHPIVELFQNDENEWMLDVKSQGIDEDDIKKLKIVRAAYLISRFAELNAGKMVELKMKYKDLWRRMEKVIE